MTDRVEIYVELLDEAVEELSGGAATVAVALAD
jgi:hypothetical protein